MRLLPKAFAQALLLLSLLSLYACMDQETTKDELLGNPNVENKISSTNLTLGIGYMRDGQYRKALEALLRARDAEPSHPAPHNMLGVLYGRLGKTEQAVDSFRTALKLAPNDPKTLNNMGHFLCGQGRVEEATHSFLQAAENPLYESPEIAWTNAGICSQTSERPEEAMKYFQQALQINPEFPSALFRMAVLSQQRNDSLSAKGFLQRYLALQPHSAASLWLGTQVESSLGNRDTAQSYGLMLLKSFPRSEEAQQYKERAP